MFPTEHSGCVSFSLVTWLTGHFIKAFRTGLTKLDLFTLPPSDHAPPNAGRLQRILDEMGEEKSLVRATWIFSRTRIFMATVIMLSSFILQFVGPVWQKLRYSDVLEA